MILNHTLEEKQTWMSLRTWQAGLIGLCTVGLITTGVWATRSWAQPSSLSFEEAQKLVGESSSGEIGIPLVINDSVLERLNRYVGTTKGRTRVREGFARMPAYRQMIERKLKEQDMPKELVALPLFESGYRIDAVSPGMYATGLWQFIKRTAERYELKVEGKIDERTDPEKSTDAAIRYLKDLHSIFGDWHLALKAYNEGENRVLKLMGKYKTRDAWKLEELDTTESYLSGAIAMMILVKNPSLVQ